MSEKPPGWSNLRPAPEPDPASLPKPDSPWLLIVFGVGFGVLIAGPGLYWVFGDSWRGLASLRWSQTRGTVVQTGLEKSYGRGGFSYALKVTYRYNVTGRDYRNNRISFPERRGSGDESYYRKQLDGKYPLGQPCTVYYSPDDPSQSCLEPGVNVFFLVLGGVLSVVFLAGAVLGVLLGVRELRRRPQPAP